jgi:hypothetical protein
MDHVPPGEQPPSAANVYIRAALCELPYPAAMNRHVALTVRISKIDIHRRTAQNRHPGIGSATRAVDTGIAHSQCRLEIDKHIL